MKIITDYNQSILLKGRLKNSQDYENCSFKLTYNSDKNIFDIYLVDDKHVSDKIIPYKINDYSAHELFLDVFHRFQNGKIIKHKIGETNEYGAYFFSDYEAGEIYVDFEETWMIADRKIVNLVDKEEFQGKIYLFEGLKNVGIIECNEKNIVKKGHIDVIKKYKKTLKKIGVYVIDYIGHDVYMLPVNRLTIEKNIIYINKNRFGSFKKIKSKMFNNENRILISMEKKTTPEVLKKIREILEMEYPESEIVYYLNEDLV